MLYQSLLLLYPLAICSIASPSSQITLGNAIAGMALIISIITTGYNSRERRRKRIEFHKNIEDRMCVAEKDINEIKATQIRSEESIKATVNAIYQRINGLYEHLIPKK